MSSVEIIRQELALTAKRENTLQTLYQNVEDYKRHIHGIMVNFESITACLSDFFHEKSSYFRPYLVFNDQMRVVIQNLAEHSHSFKGIERQVTDLLREFKVIEVRDQIFLG